MRRITVILLLFAVLWSAVGASSSRRRLLLARATASAGGGGCSITEPFTYSNSDSLPASSANWKQMTSEGNFAVTNNTATPSGSLGTDKGNIYTNCAFSADQYAQVEVTDGGVTPVFGEGTGLMIRGSVSARTYYRIILHNGANNNISIGKQVAGAFTNLGTNTVTYSAGAVLKAYMSGTTLTVVYNGSTVTNITDATIASGYPGISYSSTISAYPTLDNFAAGDGTGP